MTHHTMSKRSTSELRPAPYIYIYIYMCVCVYVCVCVCVLEGVLVTKDMDYFCQCDTCSRLCWGSAWSSHTHRPRIWHRSCRTDLVADSRM